MVASPQLFAIAPKQVDKLDIAGDIYEELEQVSNALAPDMSFDFIHAAFREHALDDARTFNAAQIEGLCIALAQGQRLLDAKKSLTRKGEFTGFRNSLLVTQSLARQYMSLAITFGDWALEKLVAISSATNIYTLTQKKYAEVVERLCHAETVTKEYVQQLLKEFRANVSTQKKKASKVENESAGGVLEQHVNGDGGFYYTLKDVNLSEDIGSKLKSELEIKSIGQVLSAVLVPSDTDLEVKQLRQELRDVVDEATAPCPGFSKSRDGASVGDVQIQLQRENIQMCERVKDLSQQLVDRDNQIKELKNLVCSATTTPTIVEQPLPISETVCKWEDIAQLVGSDAAKGGLPLRARAQFLDTMKIWTVEQKETLPKLLAEHIEANYPECLSEIGWIPDKLRDAALKRISFAVQKIVGADNLVDEPELKTFCGCVFVSLRNFGTRTERWLFQTTDGKQLPVFGREEFAVERF